MEAVKDIGHRLSMPHHAPLGRIDQMPLGKESHFVTSRFRPMGFGLEKETRARKNWTCPGPKSVLCCSVSGEL